MMPLISLNAVTLTLNPGTALSHTVFNGLNLAITSNEFVLIVGRNGAGKSSLFKLLMQEVQPESGTVIINAPTCLPMIKALQDPTQGTIGDFTVQENLNFALKRGRGLNLYFSPKHKDFFKKALAPLGLADRLNAPTHTLSGGQRQALSLLMAMMTKAPILLLDEITAALDTAMADFVMHYVTEIADRSGSTVLAITHNIDHALRYGNRLLIMDKGQIIKDYSQHEKGNLTRAELIQILG